MNNELYSDELYHYGTPRHSGRYPWGSGDNPYQHEDSFLRYYREMHADGYTDKEIADSRGMTLNELRAQKSIDSAGERAYNINQAVKLHKKGWSNVKIAERLGTTESSVRNWLKDGAKDQANRNMATADMLKRQVEENGCIDIGPGVEKELGITRTQLDTAVAILKQEGYEVGNLYVEQLTNKNQKTTMSYVATPGTEKSELYSDLNKVKTIKEYSTDGGDTFQNIEPPTSVNSSRIMVRYGEEGGVERDGTIELRRGVEDISLGGSNYAQVRIAVDGTHYMKGMAVYSDNMPDGVDIIFNTNKKKGTPLINNDPDGKQVLKTMKDDPENPFGALIKSPDLGGQRYYEDKNGNYIIKDSKYVLADSVKTLTGKETRYSLSPINKLKDAGDWSDYSKTLSSQFLSKQPQELIDKQLKLSYVETKAEFDEYMNLTNPAVKKKLLEEFADQCDSAAVDLKAAALPRQSTKVILPIDSLKDNQVYAPTYKNGESVVLIRYPHAGTFEIPELVVNNKSSYGKSVIGNDAIDAIGINSKVAERLSGADFDGDTVMVIPVNNSVKIKTSKPLTDLVGFDPKNEYPGYPGMKKMTAQQKGIEMGKVSNLITDMTLLGAPTEHIARAVKHSMVVIDAEKHGLNYKQSEIDNGIQELKDLYQGGGGASTLISRAKSETRVPERKYYYKPNEETGKLEYKNTDRTYTSYDSKGNAKTVAATTKMKLMETVEDANEISTGHPVEKAYATYANQMKSLANQARKEAVNIKPTPVSTSAKTVYAPQVKSLEAKLDLAIQNAPKERMAQRIANTVVKAKVEANPEIKESKDHYKRLKAQELTRARNTVGANKKQVMVNITDDEWEAIQAGAISTNKLNQILNNTDTDALKKRATPKTAVNELTTGQKSRIKAMLNSGFTMAEVAEQIGVSVSTVQKYSK